MRRFHRSNRDDRGVVALELVIAMPVLLMLIIGAVVLGNFLSVKGQASNLARDGARKAALFPGTPLGDARLSILIPPDGLGPCPTSPRDPSKSVTVRATLPVELNSIPFLPSVLPSTLKQQVTMRCGG